MTAPLVGKPFRELLMAAGSKSLKSDKLLGIVKCLIRMFNKLPFAFTTSFALGVNNLTICHFIFIARQLFQHVPQQANGCVLPRFNDEV